MRAGHRTHRADQHDEDGPGRRRVAEQRERGIAARQPLAHDAGAEDGREQESGAQPFSQSAVAQDSAIARALCRFLGDCAFGTPDSVELFLKSELAQLLERQAHEDSDALG